MIDQFLGDMSGEFLFVGEESGEFLKVTVSVQRNTGFIVISLVRVSTSYEATCSNVLKQKGSSNLPKRLNKFVKHMIGSSCVSPEGYIVIAP